MLISDIKEEIEAKISELDQEISELTKTINKDSSYSRYASEDHASEDQIDRRVAKAERKCYTDILTKINTLLEENANQVITFPKRD